MVVAAMIAPDASTGKGVKVEDLAKSLKRDDRTRERHGLLNGIIAFPISAGAASAAPRMARGFSLVPPCNSSTTSSMPLPTSPCIGTLHDLACPVQSPSLTQRRATLW